MFSMLALCWELSCETARAAHESRRTRIRFAHAMDCHRRVRLSTSYSGGNEAILNATCCERLLRSKQGSQFYSWQALDNEIQITVHSIKTYHIYIYIYYFIYREQKGLNISYSSLNFISTVYLCCGCNIKRRLKCLHKNAYNVS